MLKEGNDQFLVSRRALKVDVCEKKYVFNATPVAGGRFDPAGPCPAFEVPQDIAAAAEQKRAADEAKVAALVREGITPAPVKTGTDGGMHPVFLAAVKGVGDPSAGDVIRTEPYRLPGTIPAHAVPPREPIAVAEQKAAEPKVAEQKATKVATAAEGASTGSWFSRLFGGGESETTASAGTSAAKATAAAVPARPAQPAATQPASAQAAAPQPQARPAPQAAPADGGFALASVPRERPGAIPVAQPGQPAQVSTPAQAPAQAQTQAAKPAQSGKPTAVASTGSSASSSGGSSAPATGTLLGAAPVLSTSSFSR
jgi:hypothetical protein